MAIEQVNLSEWDSSLASLMRLDNALQLCNHYAMFDDYKGYMKACINAWKEVRVKCITAERENGDRLRMDVRLMFNKIITAKNNGSNPSYIVSQLSVKLEDWENMIRAYADAHNLLIRNRGNVLGGLDTE